MAITWLYHRYIINKSAIDHRYMTIDIIAIIMIITSGIIIIMIPNMLITNISKMNSSMDASTLVLTIFT